MRALAHFNNIVESVYNLTLEDKLELQNLLGHNIADMRRKEILSNYKHAMDEYNSGNMKSSSDADEIMNML